MSFLRCTRVLLGSCVLLTAGCDAPVAPLWSPRAFVLESGSVIDEISTATSRYAVALVADTIVLLPDGTGFARRRFQIVDTDTFDESFRNEEIGLRHAIRGGKVDITWLPVCAGWCLTPTTQVFTPSRGDLVAVGRMGAITYRGIRALAP